MEMRARINRQRQKMRWMLGTIFGVLAVIGLVYSFLGTATRPIDQANHKYSQIALDQKALTSVTNFYWNARQKTYYTILGKDAKNRQKVVIVAKGTQKLHTYLMKDGVTAEKAQAVVTTAYQPKKITNIGMSMYAGVPVWEVTFIDKKGNLNYITVQFYNGKIVRTIRNL